MKVELFNDNFQNYKRYGIPKAQLVIADIPYNLGGAAYASNPMWYIVGDKAMLGIFTEKELEEKYIKKVRKDKGLD